MLLFVTLAIFCCSEWDGVGNVTCMDRSTQGFGWETWSRQTIWKTKWTGRWEHSIKMNFKKITWDGMNWTNLACDRDHWWAVVDGQCSFNCVEFPDYLRTYLLLKKNFVTWSSFIRKLKYTRITLPPTVHILIMNVMAISEFGQK